MTEQALRYNKGKLELSYLMEFQHALQALVRVLMYGAKKYARGNWKKGLPKEQVVDSLLRHLNAYMNGEIVDPESGEPHVGHIVANAMFLAEFDARGDYLATGEGHTIIFQNFEQDKLRG